MFDLQLGLSRCGLVVVWMLFLGAFSLGAFADDFALGTDFSECHAATSTTNCGELHRINLTTGATQLITTTSLMTSGGIAFNTAAAVGNQPNAQAWDNDEHRFYYAEAIGGRLYVWHQTDDGTPNDDHFLLGDLNSATGGGGLPATPDMASAAFYRPAAPSPDNTNGIYYFVIEETDDLWKVTFNTALGGAPVSINSVEKVADITGNNHAWKFGDIAIDNFGVLYGSGLRQDGPSNNGEVEFFKFRVETADMYMTLRSDNEDGDVYMLAQLTFNTPFDMLYAFDSTLDGTKFFTVDLSNGMYSEAGTSSPHVLFRDVGGAADDDFPVELQSFSINGE